MVALVVMMAVLLFLILSVLLVMYNRLISIHHELQKINSWIEKDDEAQRTPAYFYEDGPRDIDDL